MARFDVVVEVSKNIDLIHEIEKFNPYHGRDGRFTSPGAATSFTYKPGQGAMYDKAIAREKERIADISVPPIRPRRGLVLGLGEQHAENIEKLIQDNAPDEVKAVWSRFGHDIKVGDTAEKYGYYSAIDATINIDLANDAKRNYKTTLHESGHNIDGIIYEYLNNGVRRSTRFAAEYNNGEFQNKLVKEANELFKRVQTTMSQNSGRKVSIGEARRDVERQVRAQAKKVGVHEMSPLCDILEGATKGKFQAVSGHGKAYWNDKKDYQGRVFQKGTPVATEAFAHMFQASSNGIGLKYLKQFFPESYKTFTKICNEAAKSPIY